MVAPPPSRARGELEAALQNGTTAGEHDLYVNGGQERWFDLYRAIVMPAQCDIYGHMNVRHYAACFDDAGWHFPRMAGFSLAEFRARGYGTVVATLSIDFHREICAGQLVLVRGAVTRVGIKSFAHEMRLFEADSMTHCATQKTVEVCFDTAARKGVPLPEDIKASLQRICIS